MNKTIIIAEAGVNHNGLYNNAIKLVDEAKKSGADYIKFQTFKSSSLVSKDAKKADYQKKQKDTNDDTQYEMLSKLELTENEFRKIASYCKKINIGFLSTAFDQGSFIFLKKLNMDYWKIPSGEINNKPFLLNISKEKKPVILSTGMANLAEIEAAIEILVSNELSRNDITLLHCTTEYPAPLNEVNLNAMITLKNAFKTEVGYSDHTKGINIPIAAVTLGAKIIEKHFTLDKKMEGPDHIASLEPYELKQMISSIREVEKSLGNGIKTCTPSENKNKLIARKSIHLKNRLESGKIISASDLIMSRPGDGISPMSIELIIGKKTLHDLPSGHKLKWEDIK